MKQKLLMTTEYNQIHLTLPSKTAYEYSGHLNSESGYCHVTVSHHPKICRISNDPGLGITVTLLTCSI